MKKQLTAIFLSGILSLGLLPTAALAAPSAWAAADVDRAIAAKLVPGDLQSSFQAPITRREFTALVVSLYRAATGKEIDQRRTFTDTTDPNVEKAAGIGVVNGVDDGTRFHPEGGLTREQAAAMLARLSEKIGKPLSTQKPTFADTASVGLWAVDSVGQMQSSGIMKGITGNRFDPKGAYSREQSITTVLRLLDSVRQTGGGGNRAAFMEELNWLSSSLERSIAEIEIANTMGRRLPSSDTFVKVNGDELRAKYPDQSLSIGYLEAAREKMIDAGVCGIDIYFYEQIGSSRSKIQAARDRISIYVSEARSYLSKAAASVQ